MLTTEVVAGGDSAPTARAAALGETRTIGSAASDCLYGAKDNPVRPRAQLEIQPNRIVCEAQPHALVVAS